MLTSVLVCIAAGLAAPALHRRAGEATSWILAAVALALFAYFGFQLPGVAAGETVRESLPWVPGLEVELSFTLDGLSLLFALLITGLGALILAYSGPYLKGHRDRGRFFLAFLLFMGAMLGLVLADNLIALFVFWELTSFSSYLLIGFDHEREAARRAALQAMLVTAGGGLALLAGFVLLGIVGGSFELSQLGAQADLIRGHALYLPILILVAAGAFTKSAQFPFHFWLPNAMEAPTPVSAYLHSATMVKAGVYLLARTDHILGGTPEWIWLLTVAGAITMVVGAVLAVRHTELKLVLAYSTVMALGTLVLLIGLSVPESLIAAVVFLFVHALYKASLFLTSGAVDHETGTRDVRELGGLRGVMPVTAFAAVLAGLSMAGLPPLFGFMGKEMVYEVALGFGEVPFLLPLLGVVANALTVAAAGLVVLRPFFGARRETPKAPHEAPFAMWIGPLVGGVAGLLFGALPRLVDGALVGPAASAMLAQPIVVELELWHGLGWPLALSIVTVAAGVLVYLLWGGIQPALARADDALSARLGPERGYDLSLDGMMGFARWQTRTIQTGSLRRYVQVVVAVFAALAAITLFSLHELAGAFRAPEATFYEWGLAALVGAAGVTVAVARSRLLAIAGLGVAGFGIALLYILLGAPDLAMTQVLVETLTVVVILLVVFSLPAFRETEEHRLSPAPGRDAFLALATGAVVTVLLLLVTRGAIDPTVADYFVRESYPGGHGRNIVNVILVDFRALDTLGEITVLGAAGLGVYAVIRLGAGSGEGGLLHPQSLIVKTATRLLIALLLLFSVFLLWRGHNEPGGGFIGGLVSAGAFTLYGIAFGWRAMLRLLRVHPRVLIGVGLGLAILSGLFALAARAPFLTGQWLFLGGVEDGLLLKLGTPLLFDVGVFLVVNGFALTVILALERTAGSFAPAGRVPGGPSSGPPAGGGSPTGPGR